MSSQFSKQLPSAPKKLKQSQSNAADVLDLQRVVLEQQLSIGNKIEKFLDTASLVFEKFSSTLDKANHVLDKLKTE
jgi:hypothetical protein